MEAWGPGVWAVLALGVACGYVVFGLIGFGATLAAMPLLALVLPLKVALPVMLLLDLLATAVVGGRNWRIVAWREWARLVPCMLVGQFAGVRALVLLPAAPLLLGLGVFILANALWSLWGLARPALAGGPGRTIHAGWAVPAGVAGGAFGGMFGSGGPVYAIYLSRRLDDMAALRATTATMLLVSSWLRLGYYVVAGLYAEPQVWWLALLMLPAAGAGLWLGSRLHGRWPDALLRRVLYGVLLVGGLGVVLKALSLG